ncbi:MAG: hypothetical protein ACKVVT_17520 [Dehalococcoidia bacterium]
MNIFPTDKPVHTNLSTTFTSFDALLEDLGGSYTNGYIRVSFPGYEGALFLTGGVPVGAMEVRDGARRMGPAALESVSQRARERGGAVDVYALDPELVPILAAMSETQAMHRDLTSEWVDVGRLLDWLRGCGQPGHLDLRMSEGDGEALAIFGAGRIVAAMASAGGRQLIGEAAIEFMTRTAQAAPAVINVFRAVPAAIDSDADLGARPSGRGAASPRPLGLASRREAEPVAAIAAASVEPARVPDAVSAPQSASRTEVLQSWSTILSTIQDVCAEVNRNLHFDLALRETLLEVSETYLFLDPFAAEFEFIGGEAKFAGPLPEHFAKAMNQMVESLISRLAIQLRRPDFEAMVKSRIAGLSRVVPGGERSKVVPLAARAS